MIGNDDRPEVFRFENHSQYDGNCECSIFHTGLAGR